jgi:WD40 repeat protein
MDTVAFSPDGTWLAVAGTSLRARAERMIGATRVYSTDTATKHLELEHPSFVQEVSISPTGQLLATCGAGEGAVGGAVWLWELPGGKRLRVLKQVQGVDGIAFSPDGAFLATCGRSLPTRLWTTATGKVHWTSKAAEDAIEVRFSPDGLLLALATEEGAILLDAATGEVRRTLERDEEVHSVAFSPDSRLLATGTDVGVLSLWRLRDGKKGAVMESDSAVESIAFHPGGDRLATGHLGPYGRQGGEAVIWTGVPSSLVRGRVLRHTSHPVFAVTFDPTGSLLATAGYAELGGGKIISSVRVWEIDTGNERVVLTGRRRRLVGRPGQTPLRCGHGGQTNGGSQLAHARARVCRAAAWAGLQARAQQRRRPRTRPLLAGNPQCGLSASCCAERQRVPRR